MSRGSFFNVPSGVSYFFPFSLRFVRFFFRFYFFVTSERERERLQCLWNGLCVRVIWIAPGCGSFCTGQKFG